MVVPVKTEILEELGEGAVLLPERINRALAANDRVKYFLTLLQAARDHAEHQGSDASWLKQDREASGVSDTSFDTVVIGSARIAENVLHIPHAERLHTLVVEGLGAMLEPLNVVAADDDAERPRYDHYRQRLDQLLATAPRLEADHVPTEYIDAMTRARQGEDDSIHLLVMDLHRELNRLQQRVATESVDGAVAYGLGEGDRPLVSAFMAGVNATAPLKFDHPGLSTSATRAGDRLIIQNDIGTTDLHVVVLHVVGLTLTMTYTDVHRSRLEFLKKLLESEGFEWTADAGSASNAAYQRTVGRVSSPDEETLRRHLTVVGSRLVFLIDWNRARKRLSRFVKKADAIDVLQWAAEHQVGHRAFLQMGDVRLVYTAIERAGRTQIRFGARLDEILGRESARSFLQSLLRVTSEGLRNHQSARLIQDEVHAELLTHLQTNEQGSLALAADHAMLLTALAALVSEALAPAEALSTASTANEFAARAKLWESQADQLVSRARSLREPSPNGTALARLLSEADDVADGLEEVAFLLTLVPHGQVPYQGVQALRDLAELMTSGTRSYVKCIECARDTDVLATYEETEEFLVAIDAVIAFEHASDERERIVKAMLVEVAQDFRALHVLSEIAACLGDAADALARCALILRDYILEAPGGRQ
jgi:uncharacterized protein Yka (UPF0111/DUF47 family)